MRDLLTTLGDLTNETSVTYKEPSGQAAHTIRILERVSPEALLVHHSKVWLFYKKLRETPNLQPTPKAVKASILL